MSWVIWEKSSKNTGRGKGLKMVFIRRIHLVWPGNSGKVVFNGVLPVQHKQR